MHLLIVDDNRQLAQLTAEVLRWMDRGPRNIESIAIAADLQTALRLLPSCDAVLCDGQFPVSPNFWYRQDQWVGVYDEAAKHATHFILYSGDAETLDQARRRDIPAIAKPSRIERLYAALLNHSQEARDTVVACGAIR